MSTILEAAKANNCKVAEVSRYKEWVTYNLAHRSRVDFTIERSDSDGSITLYAFEGHYQEPLMEQAFSHPPEDMSSLLGAFIKDTLAMDMTQHLMLERPFNE